LFLSYRSRERISRMARWQSWPTIQTAGLCSGWPWCRALDVSLAWLMVTRAAAVMPILARMHAFLQLGAQTGLIELGRHAEAARITGLRALATDDAFAGIRFFFPAGLRLQDDVPAVEKAVEAAHGLGSACNFGGTRNRVTSTMTGGKSGLLQNRCRADGRAAFRFESGSSCPAPSRHLQPTLLPSTHHARDHCPLAWIEDT
jgi:hypothetical protein